MSAYELAQLNIARMKEPLESPTMADFVANLDRINALAESSPGFVWRLQTAEGDATALRPLGADTLVNVSVWRDVDSLNKYVYSSAHVEIMRRRKEWFERMREAYVVLWWVPRGHRPPVSEAIAKLELLRANGPTRDAFTFRRAFLAPDAAPPDGDGEERERDQHVEPDPPALARRGLGLGLRGHGGDAANLGGAVEHGAAVRAVLGARGLRSAARRAGAIGALVVVTVDAKLLALLREVALRRVLRGAAVGAVALALAEQAARVAELAVPEHLEVALTLLAFLPHCGAS